MDIVYECIEPGLNDPAAVQKMKDFFRPAGLSYTPIACGKNR